MRDALRAILAALVGSQKGCAVDVAFAGCPIAPHSGRASRGGDDGLAPDYYGLSVGY